MSNKIYTIGREFGSGGKAVGEALANRLGIKLYDKELLQQAAKDSGFCEEIFENHDEKPTSSFLYSLVMDTYSVGSYNSSPFLDMPLNHKVFLAQFETIKKIAARGYDLSAQVLKQPHHGYQDVRLQDKPKGRYVYDSDHKYLIDRTGASIAIISNGYKNVNQTPESNVLRDLSGMDVYQTSDKGTIVVSSDGKNLSVSAQKGGNVPSHAGYVVKQKRTPLMQKVTVQANTKKKMTPLRSDASAAYQHYERKNIKIRISAQAKSFTNLKQIQYKFVKKGTSKGSVPYKTGTTLTLRDGMIGRVYVRFVTDAGIDEMQLSGIAVDKKAPTKTKIKVNRSGIKTLKTSTKTSYNKKIKKSAKFVFSASYGISGKSKTQYKIVPKGKKASKYRWKTANKITYKKKNKKVSIYARFIDKCGNITQRKSSGFYITK